MAGERSTPTTRPASGAAAAASRAGPQPRSTSVVPEPSPCRRRSVERILEVELRLRVVARDVLGIEMLGAGVLPLVRIPARGTPLDPPLAAPPLARLEADHVLAGAERVRRAGHRLDRERAPRDVRQVAAEDAATATRRSAQTDDVADLDAPAARPVPGLVELPLADAARRREADRRRGRSARGRRDGDRRRTGSSGRRDSRRACARSAPSRRAGTRRGGAARTG